MVYYQNIFFVRKMLFNLMVTLLLNTANYIILTLHKKVLYPGLYKSISFCISSVFEKYKLYSSRPLWSRAVIRHPMWYPPTNMARHASQANLQCHAICFGFFLICRYNPMSIEGASVSIKVWILSSQMSVFVYIWIKKILLAVIFLSYCFVT